MQFQEVTVLVKDTKYKIVSVSNNTYQGTFVSANYLHRFKNVYGYDNLNGNLNFIPHYHKYYVPIFQKERIQSDMERRAVNLILQIIVGDPSFKW
jgi:nicotinamide mononucleotide adenylyltransferase